VELGLHLLVDALFGFFHGRDFDGHDVSRRVDFDAQSCMSDVFDRLDC
jgi:hypothetical protein